MFNNNNQKRDYSPTTYSGVKLHNIESQVDKTGLGYSYWNHLLRVTITPYKNTPTDSFPEYDQDKAVTIHLSPMKAKMLSNLLRQFIKNPNEFDNIGVPTNKGIIYFSNGNEFHRQGKYVVIKLIDFKTSQLLSTAAYQFNNSNYFTIRNYVDANSFEQIDEPGETLEMEMFLTVLEEYIKASTCAVAASVAETLKYDFNRLYNRLGNSSNSGGGSNGYANSNSYWNSNKSSSMNSSASNSDSELGIDDISSIIDEISAIDE